MPWNEPGGKNRDPWSGGKKETPSNPDFDAVMNKLNKRFGGIFNKGSGDDKSSQGGIIILIIVLLIAWSISGFYTIEEGQRGVELRFGAYNETTTPGWHWHFPTPIEAVEKVYVDHNRSAADKASMLTLDENIIDISVSAQYRIKDVKDYLFNVYLADNETSQIQGTLQQVMSSAIREVIGRSTMDDILVQGREKVATDTRFGMQTILDNYQTGLEVLKVNLTDARPPQQVEEAFNDAIKAREDEVKYTNQAETYAKSVVPKARGKAARMLEDANAGKAKSIATAEGDAGRFSQLYSIYTQAPQITRQRLYLETMENVFSSNRKVIIDSNSGNNLMYLPLDKLGAASNTAANQENAPNAAMISQAAEALSERRSDNIKNESRSRQPRSSTENYGREAR